MPPAGFSHAAHRFEAGVETQRQPHLGQLEADIGVELLGRDALDRLDVVACCACRRGSIGDALAEHVERGPRSGDVQGGHRVDRIVEGRARHEAQCNPAQERDAKRQPRHPAAPAEPQEEGAQRRGEHRR